MHPTPRLPQSPHFVSRWPQQSFCPPMHTWQPLQGQTLVFQTVHQRCVVESVLRVNTRRCGAELVDPWTDEADTLTENKDLVGNGQKRRRAINCSVSLHLPWGKYNLKRQLTGIPNAYNASRFDHFYKNFILVVVNSTETEQ